MPPSDDSPWVRRTLRIDGRPMVDWAPLGSMGNPECMLGILRDGTWVVDTADGLVALDEDRSLVFVLPLLSASFADLHAEIQEALARNRITVAAPRGFPYSRLVTYAIEGGGFWAEKAFDWLGAVSMSDSEIGRTIGGLKRIEENPSFQQQLRHAARRHRIQCERRPH